MNVSFTISSCFKNSISTIRNWICNAAQSLTDLVSKVTACYFSTNSMPHNPPKRERSIVEVVLPTDLPSLLEALEKSPTDVKIQNLVQNLLKQATKGNHWFLSDIQNVGKDVQPVDNKDVRQTIDEALAPRKYLDNETHKRVVAQIGTLSCDEILQITESIGSGFELQGLRYDVEREFSQKFGLSSSNFKRALLCHKVLKALHPQYKNPACQQQILSLLKDTEELRKLHQLAGIAVYPPIAKKAPPGLPKMHCSFEKASREEVLALQGILQNPNPHHSMPSLALLETKKLLPNKKITVDNATYYCSDPLQIGSTNGRFAVVAIVVIDGVAILRDFYFSHSQGVWRVIPEVVKSTERDGDHEDAPRRAGHIGKGFHEVDTNLPHALNIALSTQMQKDMSLQTLPEIALNLAESAPLTIALYPESYAAVVHRVHVQASIEGPATFTKLKKEDAPDFSQCVHEYQFWSPLYGQMKGYIYSSHNRIYSYTFYEIVDLSQSSFEIPPHSDLVGKTKGLVFMAASEGRFENPVTSYGNRTYFHTFDLIDLPLFEYRKQHPQHIGQPYKSGFLYFDHYVCTWNVVRENPYVQQFYGAHKRSLPDPL